VSRKKEIWAAVNRAVGRRRIPGDTTPVVPPTAYTVTIEGEAVTVDASDVTIT